MTKVKSIVLDSIWKHLKLVYIIDFIDDIDKNARAKIMLMHIMLYLPLLSFLCVIGHPLWTYF